MDRRQAVTAAEFYLVVGRIQGIQHQKQLILNLPTKPEGKHGMVSDRQGRLKEVVAQEPVGQTSCVWPASIPDNDLRGNLITILLFMSH